MSEHRCPCEAEASLDHYLDQPIKAIIDRFPTVADALAAYDVGCVHCSVGSCRLRDVFEIHNLSAADERALLKRIAGVLLPGRDVPIPRLHGRAEAKPPKGRIYSPPLRKLVEEHTLIKRCVACVPALTAAVDVETEADRALVREVVDFIRNYADRYHHAKEEDVLFTYFDAGLDILQVMHADHEAARAHVRAIVKALDRRDRADLVAHLAAWHDLLTEHIRKEDEVLYPWMDRHLETSQVGRLWSAFAAIDAEFGDAPKRYEALVNRLEQLLERSEDHARL